jgi:hypothetical protein
VSPNPIDYTARRFPGGCAYVPPERVLAGRKIIAGFGLPGAVTAAAPSSEMEEYQAPLDLFLKFANTPKTREAIIEFAGTYGLLGLAFDAAGGCLVTTAGPTDQSSGPRKISGPPTGELLGAWQLEISKMQAAVTLWTAIREANHGDRSKLEQSVFWRGRKLVYFDTHSYLELPPGAARLLGIKFEPKRTGRTTSPAAEQTLRTFGVIASEAVNPEWLRVFPPGDLLLPARYHLQKLVNEPLLDSTAPQLLWSLKGGQSHDLSLFFAPKSLLGLIWLQMAETINGNRQFRPCRVCKNLMLISRETAGNRSSRLTCSTACRMKRYADRIAEAQRLRASGLSIKEIAKRLEADPPKVRRWVGE